MLDNIEKRRLLSYWLIAIGLTLSYIFVYDLDWQGSVTLHTIMEVVATVLAFIVGAMALVRYYSKPDPVFLILGAGFIGTAALDGYHAIVTSAAFKDFLPSELPALIPWSWVASRLYLSLIFLSSYIAWRYISKDLTTKLTSARNVYLYMTLATVSSFIFFIFAPLPAAYYPDLFFHRPEELIPALFFALALWGYLNKGAWRHNSFEHWLVIALIINLISQLVFMPLSGSLFDAQFDLAHVLKKASYIAVLIGLFISMYHSFKSIELMAHYDVVTKLPNRILFADRFKQQIAYSNRNELLLGVCFLDLDNFKPVNDTYGHKVGDILLVQVAERIKNEIREADTLSRHGGDEFSLLLSDIRSIAHCEQMLERIHASIAEPFYINDESITISASSGITLYPNDNNNLEVMLRHADQAMYQAKIAGRNRFRIYDALDEQHISKQHLHLQEVRNALVDNELTLYYQPKVNITSGKVYGFEALIRWLHPQKGTIPPLQFLPLIEDTDVEIQIGQWVIETALQQLTDWQQQGLQFELSINISSHHLQSDSFLPHLEQALSSHPIVDTRHLQLEVLESSALNDLVAIEDILKQCRNNLGIQIALDDFGTGYSSLTHLRNLPVDIIKIDRSFISDVLDQPDSYSITEGIIGLSNAFNRHSIAEGVETFEHGLLLSLIGCKHAQGYGISRPMPASEVITWVDNYKINQGWADCATRTFSPIQKELKIFKLVFNQWVLRIRQTINLMDVDKTSWPILSKKNCHMGIWLYRHFNDELINKEALVNLEQSHSMMHLIAQDLAIKFQSGDLASAQAGLAKFDEAVLAIHVILNQIEQDSL